MGVGVALMKLALRLSFRLGRKWFNGGASNQ